MSRILHEQIEKVPDGTENIVVEIYRFDPAVEREGHLQCYEIPAVEAMTVLQLLRHIYAEHDPTLAFRNAQCNEDICNVCRVRLEPGGLVRGCKHLVHPGDRLAIYPANINKVIRDLVTEY